MNKVIPSRTAVCKSTHPSGEVGAILPLILIVILPLFAFFGMGFDVYRARIHRYELQRKIEYGAIAGLQEYVAHTTPTSFYQRCTAATRVAEDVVEKNTLLGVSASADTIEIDTDCGLWFRNHDESCLDVDNCFEENPNAHPDSINAIRLTTQDTDKSRLPTIFAHLVDLHTLDSGSVTIIAHYDEKLADQGRMPYSIVYAD